MGSECSYNSMTNQRDVDRVCGRVREEEKQ